MYLRSRKLNRGDSVMILLQCFAKATCNKFADTIIERIFIMCSKQLSLFYSNTPVSTPASSADAPVSVSAVLSKTSSEPVSSAAQAYDEARPYHTLMSVCPVGATVVYDTNPITGTPRKTVNGMDVTKYSKTDKAKLWLWNHFGL